MNFFLYEETVAHYTKEQISVDCAMVNLSKDHDRMNNSSLCDKLNATCLIRKNHQFDWIHGRNTVVCTSYEGSLSN